MKNTLKLALFGAAFSAMTASGAYAADCAQIAAQVTAAINAAPAKVLETVQSQIVANNGCACEVVRAAILASDADKAAVAEIVRTAILASPDESRLIAQCAVATAPDAIAEVQAVLSSIDPAQGESASAKGGVYAPKGGVPQTEVVDNNPLDFPIGDGEGIPSVNAGGGTGVGNAGGQGGGAGTQFVGPPPGGPGGPGVFLPPGGLGGTGGQGGTPPIVTNPEVSSL